MNDKLMLDIGCGENKREGSVGLDARREAAADVVGDARQLPFRNEAFNHVYSSHMIEHLSHAEVKSVMCEWVRVLKHEGMIEIRCPDLRFRALLFFFSPTWQNLRKIYGEQDYEGNYHKSGFSYGLLRSLLESCGIKDVKRVIKGYKGVPFVPDSLHVKGVKV